ncbi:MAG: TRAP transporter permease [Oscillospiraceae bacterium]|nr:TRAP transporter permease [Oscillospiraceae bacterium]
MSDKDNEDVEREDERKHDAGVEENQDSDDGVVSEEEIKRVMAQFDKGSNTRHFVGVPKIIVRWICVAFALFMILINIGRIDFFGLFQINLLLPPQAHLSAFVGLVVFFTFALFPASRKNNVKVNHIPWYDVLLGLVGTACFMYHAFNFDAIIRRGMTFTQMEFIIAIIGIVILFIACHRVLGTPLMVVVGVFILYFHFGWIIPGPFGHPGRSWEFIFTRLFYGVENGLLGIPTRVASSFIFVFLIFGAFLEKTGIGQFFIDLANGIAGRAAGGPAKAAVIVSALEGMISGSSVANTVASGSFTIPLMKRLGYNKNFAGAVEAAASTGGQLVPPILGAAAFLMAEITGIPYTQIALAALIPAILYFACVFASVHFEAKKMGMKPMPADEIPKVGRLIAQKSHLMLGIVAVIVFLSMGYTPTRSAMLAILVSIAVSMFRKDTRLTPKSFFDALETGARNTIGIGVACAMAGLLVGVVTISGLGIVFQDVMLSVANYIGNETLRLLVVLFFTMLASLILGMGVPTTAKYVIMATVTAPILVRMGVPVLVAHMFVFYFGTDADITPPVGLASYAAAAISRGSPLMTSVIATRLAIAAYIVPYIFVFNPQILFIDATAFDITKIIITGMVGIIGVASALSGYLYGPMQWWHRIVTLAGGLLLINPSWPTVISGVVLVAGVVLLQKARPVSPRMA